MKIVFFQRGTAANGFVLRNAPLGGTESAMVSMAESLAKKGHQVIVFCETKSCNYESVRYCHWSTFETFALNNDIDVFISIRDLVLPLIRKWAKVQIYFSPDAVDQPFLNEAINVAIDIEQKKYQIGLFNLKNLQGRVNKIFCVGHWQKETFKQKYSYTSESIFVAGNGVSKEFYFKSKPLSQRSQSLVYASTPYRGLEWLVSYWPKIKALVPNAECKVLSGMQIYGMSDTADEQQYGDIYRRAKEAGISVLGARKKDELASVFSTSRVLAYPNTFAETFCMTALEAQSCGLPVVTSDLGAMKERVQSNVNGFLIPGHPREVGYCEQFIQHVVELLVNDELWQSMSIKSVESAGAFCYDELAAEWEAEFYRLIKSANPIVGYYDGKYETSISTLIDGYAKQVHISDSVVRYYLSDVLRQYGFIQSAGHFNNNELVSST